jgi:signal transduction histidine kinase
VALGEVATEAWSDLSVGSSELVVESDLLLRAEQHHLRHLLANLFQNAVDHGSTGAQPADERAADHDSASTQSAAEDAVEGDSAATDRLTVRVGELAGGDGFYFEDDGPGIPEAERERVFEAGYTTDHNGIGLGLTFVAQLADAYGWEYALTEGSDGGARFEFTNVAVASE